MTLQFFHFILGSSRAISLFPLSSSDLVRILYSSALLFHFQPFILTRDHDRIRPYPAKKKIEIKVKIEIEIRRDSTGFEPGPAGRCESALPLDHGAPLDDSFDFLVNCDELFNF